MPGSTALQDATKLPLSDEATAAFLNAQDPVECALEANSPSNQLSVEHIVVCLHDPAKQPLIASALTSLSID